MAIDVQISQVNGYNILLAEASDGQEFLMVCGVFALLGYLERRVMFKRRIRAIAPLPRGESFTQEARSRLESLLAIAGNYSISGGD